MVNNKELIELSKVIKWLDKGRWEQDFIFPKESSFGKIIEDRDLKPRQKILIHWLVYITNRGKRADTLWEINSKIIKSIVEGYSKKNLDKNGIKDLLNEELEKQKKGKKIQAYPADLESIKRTLIILLNYNKDIIYFMTHKLQKWKDKKNMFLRKIAFSLYLLSYKNIGSLAKSKEKLRKNQKNLDNETEKMKKILKDEKDFEREFEEWFDNRYHKRLWAALRDYKKEKSLLKIFSDGIKDEKNKIIWKKENFLNQLELPGDLWNERFNRDLIIPLIKDSKKKKSPIIARKVYDDINGDSFGFYPEQFDVSFDFASRMCNKNLCEVCPFGKNGSEEFCDKTEKKKLCPILIISCGYKIKCNEMYKDCPIRENIGKGICKH